LDSKVKNPPLNLAMINLTSDQFTYRNSVAIAVKLLTDLLHSPRPSCEALLPEVKVRGAKGAQPHASVTPNLALPVQHKAYPATQREIL